MNLAFRLAGDPAATGSALPGSLKVNRRLGQWLRFYREGYVEAFPGKVELGQGITTALAQIVAEELDVPLACVRMIPAATDTSPDEAMTSGSLSVQESGSALRQACAEARAIYLQQAAQRLDVPASQLAIVGGQMRGPTGLLTSYWELADDALLEREATGGVAVKLPADYGIVGTPVPRLDLAAKVFGLPRFIHDLVLPGMVHGRVLRPATQGATLSSLDETVMAEIAAHRSFSTAHRASSTAHVASSTSAHGASSSAHGDSSTAAHAEAAGNVSVHDAPADAETPFATRVVRDGSFMGVIAGRERDAQLAVERLAAHAQWSEGVPLPAADDLARWLKVQRADTTVIATKPTPAPVEVDRTVRATFSRPFTAHASIGVSCAIAQWRDGRLDVWSHSQGIFNLRRDLALALDLDERNVFVHHAEGAGCYGHNPADDVAFDAARLALEAEERPVRVQWSRADELAWAAYGPAMLVELEADLDASNAIVGWRHETWSNGHSTRPGRAPSPALLGAWHLARGFERLPAIDAPLAAGGGAERNSVPGYAFAAWDVVKHRVLSMPIRTSALRALGAFANVFAIESFIDELASIVDSDPIAFRLRHLEDERGRAVIARVVDASRWHEWRPREGWGRGIAYARYKATGAWCAVVAIVEVAERVRVRRLFIAVDVGQVINPDGVANQIEGGAIQAASWTVLEEVRFDAHRITSSDWETYPILRFSDVPEVDVAIIDRPDRPCVGAGEAAMGPTAGAIANAVHDALGVRVRDLPITPERIMAAMNGDDE